ncbi:hypothetical protein GE09DRAFT_742490 [Coniochaeta sp. 2T2.1]|nr:hypothetical protein GE09DRAFT_742490 [Coniochaeta sp. 2T2.1]
MRTGTYNYLVDDLLSLLGFVALLPFCVAIPYADSVQRRSPSNPLNIDWDPAPAPEDGPPASAGAIRDPAYLPIQIGGIVGSYAVSLVLVAIGLLALAKTRRAHLRAGEAVESGELELPTFQFEVAGFKSEEEYFAAIQQYQEQQEFAQHQEQLFGEEHAAQQAYPQRTLHPSVPYPLQTPKSPYKNFSRPDLSPNSPVKAEYNKDNPFIVPSPASTLIAPGYDLSVDQSVISADREMAQQQLEDMYKHVMEQEEAKLQGRAYQGPILPSPQISKPGTPASSSGTLKKEKNRPQGLNLDRDEKSQSRGSSILSSILKSPRKKSVKAVTISSPIMTPMSGTFPRYGEGEEMNAIPPRQYAPVPPPPVPTDRNPYFQHRNTGNSNMPLTPEMSPTSMTSIDGRLDAVIARQPNQPSHRRDDSAMTEGDPVSASSDKSTTQLIGLPTSPKPGVNRFPSLPASPRPGQQSFPRDLTLPASPKPGQTFQREPGQSSFQRANPPAAIRMGGALPLRAYEPSLASPRLGQQTVFTRAGPLSPGLGTPYTGAAVPYSPYQPFSPVIPMTPSLVTKEDRKRMRRLEPKTPTVEMVMSSDDIW